MILKFVEFLNERVSLSDLNTSDTVLLSADNTFVLFDTTREKVLAGIRFYFLKDTDTYHVDAVDSFTSGYGAFMYECAMTQVYPKGLSMSYEFGETSNAAVKVWEKFLARTDVTKEKIASDAIENEYRDTALETHGDDYDESEIEHLVTLGNTRFIYSFGENELHRLIQQGKEYMESSGISPDELDGMY